MANSTLTTVATADPNDSPYPNTNLFIDANGDLFGGSDFGGANGSGDLFEIVNQGTAAAPAYATTPETVASFGADGSTSVSAPIADSQGNLYGTTGTDGIYGDGSVYKIANTGTAGAPVYSSTPQTLVSFSDATGDYPTGPLIADQSGNLFGTTDYSGDGGDGYGTAFELVNEGTLAAPRYSSTPAILVSFDGSGNGGLEPVGSLVADKAGNLYGATTYGGDSGDGTIFEIVNDGTAGAPVYAQTATILASFDGVDGASPTGSLAFDANGNLFGTTSSGGPGFDPTQGGFIPTGDGTVFELAKTGSTYASAPTTLVAFDGTDSQTPNGGLVVDASGNLFGTTQGGGDVGEDDVREDDATAAPSGSGTVFEVANTGTVGAPVYGPTPSTLATFDGTNGSMPTAGLAVDGMGDLYGTTESGGASGVGTVFELANAASTVGQPSPPSTGSPTISGLQPVTTGLQDAMKPFASATVSDPTPAALDSVTVKPSGAAGVLAGAGLTANPDGTYTLAFTTPQMLTQELDALTFTPAITNDGSVEATTFALTINSTSGASSSASTAYTVNSTPNQGDFGTTTTSATSPQGEVYALYEGLLARAPDPTGGETAVADLQNGASLDQLTQSLLVSSEGSSWFTPNSSNGDFVNQLYERVLGRVDSYSEQAYWDQTLANGTSRAQVADDFVFSQEHLNDIQPALGQGVFVADAATSDTARLYYGLLDRSPDASGLAANTGQLDSTMSLTGLAQSFLNSSEYAADNPAPPSNQAFVDALFENALGRSPDPGGYWTQQLDSGAQTRAQVTVGIVESAEAQQHLAGRIETGFHIA